MSASCNSQGSQWTQFSNTDYFIMRKMSTHSVQMLAQHDTASTKR